MTSWSAKDLVGCCGLFITNDVRARAAQEQLIIQIKAHDIRLYQLDKQINELAVKKQKAISQRDQNTFKVVVKQKYALAKKREQLQTLKSFCEQGLETLNDASGIRETVSVLSSVKSTFKSQKMDKVFAELGIVTDTMSDVNFDLKQVNSVFTMNLETGAPSQSDAELLAELGEFDGFVDTGYTVQGQVAAAASSPAVGPSAAQTVPPPSQAVDPVAEAYKRAGLKVSS